MRKYALTFFGILVILSGLLIANREGFSQQVQENIQKSTLPVLDYDSETAKIATAARKNVSARFNSQHNSQIPPMYRRITELPAGVVPLSTSNHWSVGLPALPVIQSDVIVTGKIVDAQAHLSEDGTKVYSEFSIQVGDTLKNTSGGDSLGNTISATRPGGAVRFASGKVQEYRISDQGSPAKGSLYVLFLKREESGGDFTILTGYELSNGVVTPLDETHVFETYKGTDEQNFLRDLRFSIEEGQKKTGGEK